MNHFRLIGGGSLLRSESKSLYPALLAAPYFVDGLVFWSYNSQDNLEILLIIQQFSIVMRSPNRLGGDFVIFEGDVP